VIDIDQVLRPVRGHPSLPQPPSLEEIVAQARRRRLQRRRLVAALAVVAVVAVSGVVLSDNGARSTGPSSTRERSSATTAAPSSSPTTTTTRRATTTTRPPAAPTSTARVAEPPPTTTSPPPATDEVQPTETDDGTPPPAPAVNPVMSSTIQDTSIGTGPGTVRYSGASWTRCGGCDVATGDSSYYYGYTSGQSYTLTFRGVQLKLYAPNDTHGGIARVTVDGGPAATTRVNFLTSGIRANGLRWDSGILPDGVHTVTFTIEPGSNQVVLFDRADVYTD
jgi:hypothetical protein